MKTILILLLLLELTTVFAAPTKQPKSSWQTNSSRIEIRKLYQEHQKKRAYWKKEFRRWSYCEPYVDTDRTLISDENGQPRIYVNSRGSEDSSITSEYHYDKDLKLRFVYIVGGAANGTEFAHRIYLDKTGNRVGEMQTLLKGPGYTFPNPWPEDELVFEPHFAFSARNDCPVE